MTFGSAIRAHLLGNAAVAALVDERVYALIMPAKPTFPLIVVTPVSTLRFEHLRGAASLAKRRVQIDAWGRDDDSATALGNLCRLALDGYVGTWEDDESPETIIRVSVHFETEQNLFEKDILGGSCRHSADYFVFHDTAGGTI